MFLKLIVLFIFSVVSIKAGGITFKPGFVCNFERYDEITGPFFLKYHCQLPGKCHHHKEFRRPNNHFDNCHNTFIGSEKYECCHPSDDTDFKTEQGFLPGFISYLKCLDYSHFICVNGKNSCPSNLNSRIWKGKATTLDTYPHLALIGHLDTPHDRWFCEGSIISERFVLTAADCQSSEGKSASHVRVGHQEICTPPRCPDSPGEQTIQIGEFIKHPFYKEGLFYHDIALVKLAVDLKFGQFVRPACIFPNLDTRQTQGFFAGYGSGTPPDLSRGFTPNDIELEIFEKDRCSQYYPNGSASLTDELGIQEVYMFCAGHPSTGNGPCVNDGGGTLQVMRDTEYCMWQIIGVFPSQPVCGQKKPAIFVRVSHYIYWIEHVVWKDFKLFQTNSLTPYCLMPPIDDPNDPGRC